MDTTPDYPEPAGQDVDSAIRETLSIFEYIAPRCCVQVNVIIRALLARGATTASAMWAIHRLINRKTLRVVQDVPEHAVLCAEDDPPAGLNLAGGPIYVYGATDDEYVWRSMILVADRDDLALMRFLTSMNDESDNLPMTPEIATKTAPQRKIRGRKRIAAAEDKKRLALLQKWDRAKSAKVYKPDFCRDNGVTVKYLTQCQDWAAARERRNSDK